jgi:hypothetical protein
MSRQPEYRSTAEKFVDARNATISTGIASLIRRARRARKCEWLAGGVHRL